MVIGALIKYQIELQTGDLKAILIMITSPGESSTGDRIDGSDGAMTLWQTVQRFSETVKNYRGIYSKFESRGISDKISMKANS